MPDDVFMECVEKTFGSSACVSYDDRIVDVGFDSLRFVQLVVLLEAAFSVRFADEKLNYRSFERIRDVSDYVDELTRTGLGPRSTPDPGSASRP